jgi:hypothetical protein
MDDDSWNNGTADVPVPLNGADLAEYEGPILRAVESCNSHNAGNLMLCFRKEWNPGVKEKVLSAIPSLEIRGGELMACATVCLKEPLTEAEMKPCRITCGISFRAAGEKILNSRKSRLKAA